MLLLTAFVILVFCTGTAEFLVAGVLPDLASDLDVGVPAAGQVVTAYALSVTILGPIITALTARLPRRGLIVTLAIVFVVGTAFTALAPTYGLLITARIISAATQATIFAIALLTAVDLLGAGKEGRAISIVASGLTIATIFGVPLGALVGGSTNWRVPFVVIACLAALGTTMLIATMPATQRPEVGVMDEVKGLLRAPVVLAVATTVVGFAGVGVVFTYLVPLLIEVTGLPAEVVPLLLLAYGVGGFSGNLIAGKLTDISLSKTLYGVFTSIAVTLALFPFVAGWPPAMIVATLLLGLLSTSCIAPLQTLVLRGASDAPNLSLAVNVSAFNLANAIGAIAGGALVGAGLIQFNGFAGSLLALLGLLLAVAAVRSSAQPTRPGA